MLSGSCGNAMGGKDRSKLSSIHMGKASSEESVKKLAKAFVTVVGIFMHWLAYAE